LPQLNCPDSVDEIPRGIKALKEFKGEDDCYEKAAGKG